jgi:hypothetical protein
VEDWDREDGGSRPAWGEKFVKRKAGFGGTYLSSHQCGKLKIGLWCRLTLALQINQSRNARIMTQAVEHLPTKHEVLSSNPTTASKEKRLQM